MSALPRIPEPERIVELGYRAGNSNFPPAELFPRLLWQAVRLDAEHHRLVRWAQGEADDVANSSTQKGSVESL
jgi:hypothetical protein